MKDDKTLQDERRQAQTDPIMERMRQLTFNTQGEFRFQEHHHPNESNHQGFDTIAVLYEPRGKFELFVN